MKFHLLFMAVVMFVLTTASLILSFYLKLPPDTGKTAIGLLVVLGYTGSALYYIKYKEPEQTDL